MKKFISLILQTTLLGVFSLNAMQPQQSLKFQIKNDISNAKIEVRYKHVGGPERSFTLVPGQPKDLENPLALFELRVVPYGKVRGLVSISTLTLGYVQSENLASKIKKEIDEAGSNEVTMVIKPGGETVTSYAGKGGYSEKGAAALSPYVYTFLPYIEEREKKDTSPLVFEQFPQVAKARDENRKIEARYFLGVGEKATPENIKAEYDARVKEWMAKKSDRRVPQSLANSALEFLYAAYNALTMGAEAQTILDKKVENELEAQTIHS